MLELHSNNLTIKSASPGLDFYTNDGNRITFAQ